MVREKNHNFELKVLWSFTIIFYIEVLSQNLFPIKRIPVLSAECQGNK